MRLRAFVRAFVMCAIVCLCACLYKMCLVMCAFWYVLGCICLHTYVYVRANDNRAHDRKLIFKCKYPISLSLSLSLSGTNELHTSDVRHTPLVIAISFVGDHIFNTTKISKTAPMLKFFNTVVQTFHSPAPGSSGILISGK